MGIVVEFLIMGDAGFLSSTVFPSEVDSDQELSGQSTLGA